MNDFLKIPSVNVCYFIVGLYYQNITTTGVWEQCWHCTFCVYLQTYQVSSIRLESQAFGINLKLSSLMVLISSILTISYQVHEKFHEGLKLMTLCTGCLLSIMQKFHTLGKKVTLRMIWDDPTSDMIITATCQYRR